MADRVTIGVSSILAATGWAVAQPCAPHWEAGPGIPDRGVHALATRTTRAGTDLYVGGRFTTIANQPANKIARWDGAAWHELGSGIPDEYNSHGFMGCCANVHAIHPEFNTVYIAGNFVEAGGVLVESIAEFTDGKWRSLAGGVANVGGADSAFVVFAMGRFGDPGQGPLYAAGTFDLAGGVAASRIARWDGQAWTPVGPGIGSAPGDESPSFVMSLVAYGDSLYAGGAFSAAGNITTLGIARWDGASWSDVGGGLAVRQGGRTPSITSMAVFDDGTGPALYVAGIMDMAGSASARNIARWNGSTWSAVGGGVGSDVNDRVWTLQVFDDGEGAALYVGGQFNDAGGQPAANIARWNGQAWSAVGAGATGAVHAMTSMNGPNGPELYIGGWFASAGGLASPYLAKWVGCLTCYANCDHSPGAPSLTGNDFMCFLNSYIAGDPYADCDHVGGLTAGDFQCFIDKYVNGCP